MLLVFPLMFHDVNQDITVNLANNFVRQHVL